MLQMVIIMYISQSSYFLTSKCALFEHFPPAVHLQSSGIEDYAQTPFLQKHLVLIYYLSIRKITYLPSR